MPDVAPPSDASPDIAPTVEIAPVREVGITQEPEVTPPTAADATSAPNVSPASSVASDIPQDMPPDVTLGLDNNVPDASSSDVTQETSTDVTTSSENSTVIDIDQTVPATSDSTPKIYSTSTKVPSGATSNLSDQDADRILQWWGTVYTSNSTSSVKSNEQSSPPEIIKGETLEVLTQDEKKPCAMYKRHFKGTL